MQPQILLLKEGTDQSQGKPQLLSNINAACQLVVDTVRTTLMSPKRGDVTKKLTLVLCCSLFNSVLEKCLVSATRNLASGTAVNFNDTKVQTHLESLVRAAQTCVVKVRAGPKDVRAYFTNTSPMTRTGQCFVACMMEQSQIIYKKKINRQHLVYLAGLINGRDSRVVDKLTSVSRMCAANADPAMDRCLYASTYNDCLNENMMEFAFPIDVAEEAISKMPFHMVQPKLYYPHWRELKPNNVLPSEERKFFPFI